MRNLFWIAIVGLLACGGGSGGGFGTGALEQGQAEELCTADCQHDIDCGFEVDPLATCVAQCASELVGWVRADAAQTILECSASLACGEDDDACITGVEPLPIHEEWEEGCLTSFAACIPPDQIQQACSVRPLPGESDDIGFWRFIAPEIMEDIIACLDVTPCEAGLECVTGVLEANGIDF